MKTLLRNTWIVISSLTIATSVCAQSKDIKVYDTNQFGIRNVLPSQTIRTNNSTGNIKVYNHDQYGLRNPFPSQEIRVPTAYKRKVISPSNPLRRHDAKPYGALGTVPIYPRD